MNKYRTTPPSIAWVTLIIVSMSCLIFSVSTIGSELIGEQQKAYNTELGKYNQIQNERKRLDAKIRASEALVKERKKERADAATALEDIQRIDRKNPSLNLGDKVQESQARNRQAFSGYQQSEKKLKQLRSKAIPLEAELKDSKIILNSLSREIAHLNDQAVAKELERRIAKLKKTTTVEGRAEVGCGEESPRKCQKRALDFAKRDASERGSIVALQSVTHIDNFQLTKDQVKTNVQAQLANIEILKKGWIGDSTYRYHIRAQVTPVISPLLKSQIRESIIQESGVVVPAIIPQGTAITSRPMRVAHKTAAEKSFDELDRETGHSKTAIEREERSLRNKSINVRRADNPKENASFQTESWYALWGIGVGNAFYPSGLTDNLDKDGIGVSVDLLGFYWPVTNSSIYGIVLSGFAESFSFSDSDSGTATLSQSRLGISTLNFLGKPIGKGFFVRVDIGVAITNVTAEDDEDSLDENSDPSFGALGGIGYGLPVGSDSSILFGLNYAISSGVSFSDEVTSNADGTYSSITFNISGLW